MCPYTALWEEERQNHSMIIIIILGIKILMSKVRGSSREELPHVQDKEQWLCFAGAAEKRYSTSKVRETQVRR